MDYRGAARNAQGFFAARAHSHLAKRRYVTRLLAKSDFVMLSETHGTKGSQVAFSDFAGTVSFWSAGTAARGGVGIIVKQESLDKFTVVEPCWHEVVRGRSGR